MDILQDIIEATSYYQELHNQIYGRYASRLEVSGIGQAYKFATDDERHEILNNLPAMNFAQYLFQIHNLSKEDCDLQRPSHYTYMTKPLLQGGWTALATAAKLQDLSHINRAKMHFEALSEYMCLLTIYPIFSYSELRNLKVRDFGLYPNLYRAITTNTVFSEPSPVLHVYECKKRLEKGLFGDYPGF